MGEKKNLLTYEGLKKLEDELQDLKAVSYTHLDVYKRQVLLFKAIGAGEARSPRGFAGGL